MSKEIKYIEPINKNYRDWEKLFEKMNFSFKTVERYEELNNLSDKDDEYKIKPIKEVKPFIKNNPALKQKVKSWVMTIHNPHLYYKSFKELSNILKGWTTLKTALWSVEVGESGETLHIQAYISFTNKTAKSVIINKLNNAEIWLSPAKGGQLSQKNYIEKLEGDLTEKMADSKGSWDMNIISRRNYSIEEFADFAVANNIPLIRQNIYKYCEPYRKAPTPTVLTKVYTAVDIIRDNGLEKVASKPIIFTGKSGAGKTTITDYLLRRFKIHNDLILMKTAKETGKRDWFKKGDIGKSVAFYSEVNYTFPKKPSLLGLLDRFPLSISGSSISNNIQLVFLNTTNVSIGWIYNATQTEGGYSEIYRRIMAGKQYYIKVNAEYEAMTPKEILETEKLIGDEFILKYPPEIYKYIDDSDKTGEKRARQTYNPRLNVDNVKDTGVEDNDKYFSNKRATDYIKSDNSLELSPTEDGYYNLLETSSYNKSLQKVTRMKRLTLEELVEDVAEIIDTTHGIKNSTVAK